MEFGIVAEIYDSCPIDTASEAYMRVKPLSRMITSQILISAYQIAMIIDISARYMIAIHRVLAIFLTRPILTRLEKKEYRQLYSPISPIEKSSIQ